MAYQKVILQERPKRSHKNYTEIDHILRSQLHLSLKEYEIVNEVYRKQNLPLIPGKCHGYYWGSKQSLADSKRVSIKLVYQLFEKEHCFEEDKHGHFRVKDSFGFKPNLENAKKQGMYSVIYHELQSSFKFPEKVSLTDEEICVLSLVCNYFEKALGIFSLSNSEIAKRLQFSKRSIANYLNSLKNKGWIAVSSTSNSRNIYPEKPQGSKYTWSEWVEQFQFATGKETPGEKRAREEFIQVCIANNIPVPERYLTPSNMFR